MKKIQAKLPCPGCNLKTAVLFRAPPAIGAEVVQFKCSGCKSDVLARVKRGKNWKGAEISIQSRVSQASPELLAMLKEDQELAAAAP